MKSRHFVKINWQQYHISAVAKWCELNVGRVATKNMSWHGKGWKATNEGMVFKDYYKAMYAELVFHDYHLDETLILNALK